MQEGRASELHSSTQGRRTGSARELDRGFSCCGGGNRLTGRGDVTVERETAPGRMVPPRELAERHGLDMPTPLPTISRRMRAQPGSGRRGLAARNAQRAVRRKIALGDIQDLLVLHIPGLQRQRLVAEPLHVRALAIQERSLGPDHRDVAVSLNNLAILYESLGRYGGSEPLKKRALAIREATLGPDHPEVAQGLNNLASLYYAQGRYGEAEPLFMRALAIAEGTLVPIIRSLPPRSATSQNSINAGGSTSGRSPFGGELGASRSGSAGSKFRAEVQRRTPRARAARSLTRPLSIGGHETHRASSQG
jgi:hypothetical protein